MTSAGMDRVLRTKISDDDVGRLIGFIGRPAWLLYALFVASYIFQAFVLGGPTMRTPFGVAAFVLVLIGGAIFATTSPTPLPLWRTVAIVAIVGLVVSLITWQQQYHDHPAGYEQWELGACNFLMFCLTIRGRIGAAWIGESVMVGLVCIWSIIVSGSPLYGLSVSYGQPVTLIACSAFAFGLHRTARAILEFREAERDRAGLDARTAVASSDDELELRVVRQLAEPTLADIAAGGTPDPTRVRSLEAALRDLIRGRSLAVEPLVTALRTVRERGVDIVVLDDLGDIELGSADLTAAARWCASQILTANATSITIRIAATEQPSQHRATASISIDGQPATAIEIG